MRQACTVGIAASVVFLLAPGANGQQLEDAEHSDSGRGPELGFLHVAGGVQSVSLQALSANNVYIAGEPLKTESFGPSFSAGAGLRLLSLTAGARFRFGTFSDWDLWTLNLDLGWHVPLGKFEPYIFVGGGFAKLAYHDTADSSATGFDIRLGGGVDYYVSNVFSLGGMVDLDLLRLSHSIVINGPRIPLTHSWSSLGFVISPSVVAALHL
jgi:Outer membrane protein beta-barrel domain